MAAINRIALFTNEYPPHVYGGAGVHVENLGRELSRLVPKCAALASRMCRGQTCASRGPVRGDLFPASEAEVGAKERKYAWAC